MQFEYKLIIIFVVVGSLNLIMRRNRNWIFGYRSPRAIKTHERFAYANTIYGWGMVAIGISYFIVISYFEYVRAELTDAFKAIMLIGVFALLFLIIEIRLAKVFKN